MKKSHENMHVLGFHIKNVHESTKTRMTFLHDCEVANLDGWPGYEAML